LQKPKSILELSGLLKKLALSPVELTDSCLRHIEKLNPALNAFITVTADAAHSQARAAEAEIRSGKWRGPLHGIPVGLKDIIDTAGVRTTAASALFKDRIPTEDADLVRCLKNAGAIILGKHNLHEFAYGGSSMVSYFGEIRNPWDPAHITGGSSGGSAAAVAAGLSFAAIGTDTAGSIREPASQCGVVGLKPTYGRVSTRGVIPLSQSLDHVGPITRTVADTAVILQAIATSHVHGHTAPVLVPDYLSVLDEDPRALRIGVPRAFFWHDLDREVAAALEQALSVLAATTSDVREISLPVDTDRTLQSIESYMYHEDFIDRSPELYQPETLRRIRSGAKYEWSDYTRTLRELRQARQEITSVFADLDVLVTPTTPVPAPLIAELKENPDLLRPRELLLLRNTRPFNVWGLPAISLPCGFTESGLPIGLQIVGPHWGESAVLRLAYAYEQATAWHKRQPKIWAEVEI
jgi:aspartyl-tRNA(Asn)/glutamyl-tRNA(Gln) amidotransferase subunit A